MKNSTVWDKEHNRRFGCLTHIWLSDCKWEPERKWKTNWKQVSYGWEEKHRRHAFPYLLFWETRKQFPVLWEGSWFPQPRGRRRKCAQSSLPATPRWVNQIRYWILGCWSLLLEVTSRFILSQTKNWRNKHKCGQTFISIKDREKPKW